MSFTTKKSIQTRESSIILNGTKVNNIIEITGGERKIDDIDRLIRTYGGNKKEKKTVERVNKI